MSEPSPEVKKAAEKCVQVMPRSLGLIPGDYEPIIQQAIDAATAKLREELKCERDIVNRVWKALGRCATNRYSNLQGRKPAKR